MKVHYTKIRVRGRMFEERYYESFDDDEIRRFELENILFHLRKREYEEFQRDHRCEDCVAFLSCLFPGAAFPECFS